MRKRIWALTVVILVLTVTGCIPAQYTKGVEAQRYPQDELPVYDDAIIYDYTANDHIVTIKYGSEAGSDEISGFYIDYFVSNEADIDEQNIAENEFEMKGFYSGFLYRVKSVDAVGKYEEKLFEIIIEVEIEFLTEQQVAERTRQKNEQILIGFWEIYTEQQYNGGEAADDVRWGFEFKDDKTYTIHILSLNINPAELTWEITDEGKLRWYDLAAQDYLESDMVLEEHDGFLVLHLSAEEEILYLYRTDIEAYKNAIADAED